MAREVWVVEKQDTRSPSSPWRPVDFYIQKKSAETAKYQRNIKHYRFSCRVVRYVPEDEK